MYNAANTATVWKQRPGATQLLPRKKWTELGRKIREDETPVQVFMRDTRSGYIKLDYVYDKAQTVGDPVPVRGDRKSTRLNSSHRSQSRMPSSA